MYCPPWLNWWDFFLCMVSVPVIFTGLVAVNNLKKVLMVEWRPGKETLDVLKVEESMAEAAL